MKERIAITGVNGFVGHHLANELLANDVEVVGVGREDAPSEALAPLLDEYIKADLSDKWVAPSRSVRAIIHLAGLAAVGPSFDNPQIYINLNSAMVTNMCEHYLGEEDRPRVVMISSGAVYSSNQPMPINESGEVSFSSPYAVSKILVENQAAYYKNRGMDCVVARPFNHIGPGQLPGFLVPDLYQRIKGAGENETIRVGNLSTKRDYTDVRDIVRAYTRLALADSLEHPLYNLCSGASIAGTDIFEMIKTAANRSDVQYEIDSSLIRPTDAPNIIGNSDRLQRETGWKPEIAIAQTIEDFIATN